MDLLLSRVVILIEHNPLQCTVVAAGELVCNGEHIHLFGVVRGNGGTECVRRGAGGTGHIAQCLHTSDKIVLIEVFIVHNAVISQFQRQRNQSQVAPVFHLIGQVAATVCNDLVVHIVLNFQSVLRFCLIL